MTGVQKQRRDQRWARPMLARGGGGFTLVELVVIVLILGILAAVAAPRFLVNVEDAEINATIRHVRAIEEAASRYLAIEGEWPEFTYWYSPSTNNLPGEFKGYLNERAFKSAPPIGGVSYSWYNFGGYVGVAIYDSNPDVAKWELLDAQFDDGDTATGTIVISTFDPRFLVFQTSGS